MCKIKIAIITEGLMTTGYGHIARCTSLYEAFLENEIEPLFIVNCDSNFAQIIKDKNPIVFDWLKAVDKLLELISGFNIAIIDSYLAMPEIYFKINEKVKKTVYFDDYLRIEYPPGIIVNGTINAENLPYSKNEKYKYFLGTNFIPLRKEFWDLTPTEHNKTTENVLIVFGGSDENNNTFNVLDFFKKKFPHYNYSVVLNNSHSQIGLAKYSDENINFYKSLNALQIKDLMTNIDLAITAAGQTTYELNRLNKKFIAVGVAENQKYNIKGWLQNKIIETEIWTWQDDFLEKIKDDFILNLNTKKLIKNFVDGQGARRICQNLIS